MLNYLAVLNSRTRTHTHTHALVPYTFCGHYFGLAYTVLALTFLWPHFAFCLANK